MSKLINGKIAANEECPYLYKCDIQTKNCPSKDRGNVRQHPFSCGAARLFDLMDKTSVKENEMSNKISRIINA